MLWRDLCGPDLYNVVPDSLVRRIRLPRVAPILANLSS